jgi:hypothetical protein
LGVGIFFISCGSARRGNSIVYIGKRPVPKGAVCFDDMHRRICYFPDSVFKPEIFKSAADTLRPQYVGAYTNYEFDDLIYFTPSNVPHTFEFIGVPTTLGTEWRIYSGIPVSCMADSTSIEINMRPTPGSSSVYYYGIVRKGTYKSVKCKCGK